MTFMEFLQNLATAKGPMDMTLSPGPYTLKISDTDARAAQILMALDDKIGDTTTLKQAESILMFNALKRMDPDKLDDDGWYTEDARVFLYAWWWLVFWASQDTMNHQFPLHEREESGQMEARNVTNSNNR